jgi:predicted DNA-binding protein
MKKVKTSFSLTPKTKHLIDILANKLELSKSAIITLAIQDFSKRMEDYNNFFDISTDKVADEVIKLIREDNIITVENTIASFYAVLIELEKRKIK